jgi:hypothetical protein
VRFRGTLCMRCSGTLYMRFSGTLYMRLCKIEDHVRRELV